MDKKELFVTKALIEARRNSLKRLFAIMRQRAPCAPCVLYAAMFVFGLWFRLVSLQLFLHKRQQSAARVAQGRPGRTRPPAFSSRYCVCAKAATHVKKPSISRIQEMEGSSRCIQGSCCVYAKSKRSVLWRYFISGWLQLPWRLPRRAYSLQRRHRPRGRRDHGRVRC